MGAAESRSINASVPVTMTATEKAAEEERSRFADDQVYHLYFINTGVTCDMLSSGLQRVGIYTDPELSRVGQNQSHVLGRVLREFFYENGVYYPLTCSSPFIAAQQTADYMLDPDQIYIVPYIGSKDEYYSPAKQATILNENANQPTVTGKRDYLFFEDMSTPMYRPNSARFLKWFSTNSTALKQIQIMNKPLEAARDNIQILRGHLNKISSSNSAEHRRALLLENYAILKCEIQWAVYEILKYIRLLYAPPDSTGDDYLRSLPDNAEDNHIIYKNRFLYICLHFIYIEIIDTIRGIYDTFNIKTPKTVSITVRRKNLRGLPNVYRNRSIRGYRSEPPFVPREALNESRVLNAETETAAAAGAGAGAGSVFPSVATLPNNSGSNSSNLIRRLPPHGISLGNPLHRGGDGTGMNSMRLAALERMLRRSLIKYTPISTKKLYKKIKLAKEFFKLDAELHSKNPGLHTVPANNRQMICDNPPYVLYTYLRFVTGEMAVPIENVHRTTGDISKINYNFELRESDTPSFVFVTHTAFLKELVRHPGVDHEEQRRITFKPNSVHQFTLYLDRRTKDTNFALYNGEVQYITEADKSAEDAPTRFLYELGVHRSKDCAGEDICRKRTCGTRTARRSGGGKTRRRTHRR